eukprot:3355242-Prymnesium_polylepis.2
MIVGSLSISQLILDEGSTLFSAILWSKRPPPDPPGGLRESKAGFEWLRTCGHHGSQAAPTRSRWSWGGGWSPSCAGGRSSTPVHPVWTRVRAQCTRALSQCTNNWPSGSAG